MRPWLTPIPYRLVATSDPDDPHVRYKRWGPDETPLPIDGHPGAFGARRRFEVHTGVDLYCPSGTLVTAVEAGTVVGVEWFTGQDADPPSPWWHPTQAVLVEGASGVVLYGEVEALVDVGDVVEAGEFVGRVLRVLRHDKGRPTSMLHLELLRPGTTKSTHPWTLDGERPADLWDPTPHLMGAT